MSETNAFTQMAMATAPAKAATAPTPAGRARSPAPEPKKAPLKQPRHPPSQRHNPNTAVSGVPRPMGNHGEKQLDGSPTQQMSKPHKKGGLAERGPSPAKSSSDRVSGLEAAMAAEADRHHPRTRPKSTRTQR